MVIMTVNICQTIFFKLKWKFLIYIVIFLCLLNYGICKADADYYNYNYDDSTPVVRLPKPARKMPDDWCSLSCGSEKHIACKYGSKCNPKPPCVKISLNKQEILDKHNDLRNTFATGEEKSAANIQVANMLALKWSDELAFLASCNLVECGDAKEDSCHQTPKYKNVGQNLWSFAGGKNEDCAAKALDGIQSWYDEVSKTNPNELKEDTLSYKGNPQTKQFTQLIWAATTYVGCAMTEKPGDTGSKCMMTCNYGPGVVKKTKAFHQGTPCSECPDPYCKTNGLCWIPEYAGDNDDDAGVSLVSNSRLLVILLLFLFKCFN